MPPSPSRPGGPLPAELAARNASEHVLRAKVLVAVDGFGEPGNACAAGELLIPTAWCGRRECLCGDTFHGVRTRGNTAIGRVRVVRGASRATSEDAIVAAVRAHETFGPPEDEAAAFLDELDGIEEGRLVRREENVLLPFPLAARIVSPHDIEYHVTDAP